MTRLFFFSFITQTITGAVGPYLQLMLRNNGYSHTFVGIVIAIGMFFSIFGPLVLGKISQKSGKPRIIIIFEVVFTVLLFIPVLFPFNDFTTVVFYALAVMVYCSINSSHDGIINENLKDTSMYGKVRAGGSLGYICMLVLSGILAFPDQGNNKSIFLNLVTRAAVFILFCLIFLKDNTYRVEQEEKPKTGFKDLGGKFYVFIGLYALTRIAHGVPEKLLAAYMTEVMGLGNSFTLFVALGTTFEVFFMIWGSRFIKKGPETCYRTLMLASLFVSVRLLIYYFFPGNMFMFIIAQSLHGITYGLAHIAATGYITEVTKREQYTLSMGVFQAVGYNFAEMIAVLAGGAIIDNLGYQTLFASYALLPVVAVVIMFILRKKLVPTRQ